MMRYYIHLFLLVIIISCDSENKFEAPAESHFVKFYGEDGNHEGVDFVVNTDGSYILLGNERVAGASLRQQIFLVKVDALGTVVWQKTFGLSGDEFAKDIELTADGRIIIAAESEKGLNDRDVYLKTISQDGAPLDSVRIGLKTIDNQEADEEVNSISIIQDGFIVSGATTAVKTLKSAKPNDTKDALHLRFSSALDLIDENTGLWSYTTELDDSEDVLVKIYEINSSQYYGFGYTNTVRNSNRDYKYWSFSLGATGDPNNNGTDLLDVIGSPVEDEILSGIIESPIQSGEGFILSGVKTKSSGESQSFIVKLQKTLFVPGEDNVLAEEGPTDLGNLDNLSRDVVNQSRMTALSQGGFLLLSNSKLLSNDKLNISLIKLSNTFLKVWQVPLFFGGAGDDFAGTVTELPDGKIVIIGTMTLGGITGQTKMVLMKLNSSGRLQD
jgi:hypothetical protein